MSRAQRQLLRYASENPDVVEFAGRLVELHRAMIPYCVQMAYVTTAEADRYRAGRIPTLVPLGMPMDRGFDGWTTPRPNGSTNSGRQASRKERTADSSRNRARGAHSAVHSSTGEHRHPAIPCSVDPAQSSQSPLTSSQSHLCPQCGHIAGDRPINRGAQVMSAHHTWSVREISRSRSR